MAYEYDNLPGLDRKFREDEEPLLVNEQPTEQTEEETDPLAGLDLLGGFMQDDYLQGLQTQASEAKQKRTQSMQTMQGIMDEVTADLERRRQEMKPRFTQQELDDRRAKSTAVTMLTSALANIANGIAVGRGGLNATVPDGYTAAYEHWNDVQKRHSARQAEYDKLTDAIWSNRLNKVKLEYGEASAEYQQAQAAYQKAMAQESKQRHDKQMLIAKNMFATGLEQTKHQNKLEEIERQGEWGVKKEETRGQWGVKKEGTKGYWSNEKQKTVNAGKGGSDVDLEDYRTMESTNPDVGTITIPDGTDVEQGYLTLAKHAIPILKEKLENTTKKEDKTKLSKLISDIQSNTFSGNDKNKEGKIKNLQKLLPNSGLTKEELDAAFNNDNGGGFSIDLTKI
jgi:hypothetical protein